MQSPGKALLTVIMRQIAKHIRKLAGMHDAEIRGSKRVQDGRQDGLILIVQVYVLPGCLVDMLAKEDGLADHQNVSQDSSGAIELGAQVGGRVGLEIGDWVEVQ